MRSLFRRSASKVHELRLVQEPLADSQATGEPRVWLVYSEVSVWRELDYELHKGELLEFSAGGRAEWTIAETDSRTPASPDISRLRVPGHGLCPQLAVPGPRRRLRVETGATPEFQPHGPKWPQRTTVCSPPSLGPFGGPLVGDRVHCGGLWLVLDIGSRNLGESLQLKSVRATWNRFGRACIEAQT